MQLNELYTYAEDNGVTVISYKMPKSEAMSVMYDGHCFIGIDPFALTTYADEKVKLGHEIMSTPPFLYGLNVSAGQIFGQ